MLTLVKHHCGTGSGLSAYGFESNDITTPAQLDAQLKSIGTTKVERFYVVSQATTWSGLDISWALAQGIISAHGFDDCVLDLLRALESRVIDTHKLRWNTCKTFAKDPLKPSSGYDLCYRVQYPMPNGRSNYDSYSIRQTGVYQEYVGPESGSVCLLLRPTSRVQERLKTYLTTGNNESAGRGVPLDPMYLHRILLITLGDHWDDYVEYLIKELDGHAEPVWFSCVGGKQDLANSHHPVDFESCQSLNVFQWKVSCLVSALEGNVNVIDTCVERCKRLRPSFPGVDESILELQNTRRQLKFHQKNIVRLAERARTTAELLHATLSCHNGARIDQINTQSSQTLSRLSVKTEAITNLSRSREKDSKTAKALTTISIIYLSASLVATIFSSNLIQLLPAGSESQAVRFAPAPQSWIPVLLACALIALTYEGVRLMEWVFARAKRGGLLVSSA